MSMDTTLEEQITNEKVATILAYNHITYVNFIALGNSISSGFRIYGDILPLIHYNRSIHGIFTGKGISYHPYTFARYCNNNDEHIYSWLVNNIRQTEMNKLIYSDIQTEHVLENGCQIHKEYYPLELQDDKGLTDILLESTKEKVTIIIYNGATGSFLDNITRQGFPKTLSGFSRDFVSMEAVLKYIQEKNRQNGTHIQVYLCGIPNLFQRKLNDLIVNRYLQQMAEKYANVVYVPPIDRRYFYHEGGKTYLDIHYDPKDYQLFSNAIIHSIEDNFSQTMAMIDIDRELVSLNVRKEQQSDISVESEIINLVAMWTRHLEKQGVEKNAFINKLKTYLLKRFSYDFYFLQKQNIKSLH